MSKETCYPTEITSHGPFQFRTEFQIGERPQPIRYIIDQVRPWIETPLLYALYAGKTPLPDELKEFCPINDRTLINLSRQWYNNSDDREVMKTDIRGFHRDIQRIVNYMAATVPVLCVEGYHGTGKTPIAQEIARRLREVGIVAATTKYTGFVKKDSVLDETRLYTGLSSDKYLQEQLLYWDSQRENGKYKNRDYISPGEESWNYWKQHWLKLSAKLYKKHKKVIICERGPISRTQSHEKDRGNKIRYPFEMNIDTRILVDNFGGAPEDYLGNFRLPPVTIPLPYTLMLDEPFEDVQARLERQGETSRRDKNSSNHERMTAFAQAYEGVLSKYEGGSKLFRRTNATSMEDKIQAGYEYVMEILDGK